VRANQKRNVNEETMKAPAALIAALVVVLFVLFHPASADPAREFATLCSDGKLARDAGFRATVEALKQAVGADSCACAGAALARRRRLVLRGKGLTDLRPLAPLRGLRDLDLRDNRISDLSPLRKLSSLGRLNLARNHVTDLSPLSGLTGLEVLEAQDNRITSIDAVAGITALERVNLARNTISDAAALADAEKLMELDLSGNGLRAAPSLRRLSQLRRLDLSLNRIVDTSPLVRTRAGSRPLAPLTLDLSHNLIRDMTPLSLEGRLDRLNLAGNPLPEGTPCPPHVVGCQR
jgi:Leucine-rich repeat (LRR) protein